MTQTSNTSATAMSTDEDGFNHGNAEVNDIWLHYASAGTGPLIMFLHGFPQYWYQFRHQLTEFSRDHQVVAPDLRGYNTSAKPDDVHAYTTCSMVEDIRQLALHLGHERLILVGHDVGGAVAWSFALHHPSMLRALIILDAPHPALFDHALHHDPDQQKASRYMLAARRPDAAGLFSANDFAVLRDALDEPFISPGLLAATSRAGKNPERSGRRCAGSTPRARDPSLLTARRLTATWSGTLPLLPSPCPRW